MRTVESSRMRGVTARSRRVGRFLSVPVSGDGIIVSTFVLLCLVVLRAERLKRRPAEALKCLARGLAPTVLADGGALGGLPSSRPLGRSFMRRVVHRPDFFR